MTTPFTADDSALLLIDHQVGTMQLIRNIDAAHAKRCAIALAKAAGSSSCLWSSRRVRKIVFRGP